MGTNLNSKSGVVTLAQKLSAGTEKHLAAATPVVMTGGSFTPAQIMAKLDSLVKLRADVDAARAAASAKVAAEEANLPPLRAFVVAYVAFLKATFGNAPDVLADFGIKPKARAQMTVEAKTAAAAKRLATRKARNTMGVKQKKSVKGAVTGILVTTVPASAPVATAPVGPSGPAANGTTGAKPG